MIRMTRRLMTAALLWACLGHAGAQEVEASDMVRGGLQVIQMVDQGKLGELWDGAAPGARKRVTRSQFIAQIGTARQPLRNSAPGSRSTARWSTTPMPIWPGST